LGLDNRSKCDFRTLQVCSQWIVKSTSWPVCEFCIVQSPLIYYKNDPVQTFIGSLWYRRSWNRTSSWSSWRQQSSMSLFNIWLQYLQQTKKPQLET